MTDTIAELRELLAKATPGDWETDTERSEGEYGSGPDTSTGYDDFLIGADIGGKWATLLTTENSTAKLIEEDYDEDYHRAWDAVGEANAKLIVAMRNALPALLDRVEAGVRAMRHIEEVATDPVSTTAALEAIRVTAVVFNSRQKADTP